MGFLDLENKNELVGVRKLIVFQSLLQRFYMQIKSYTLKGILERQNRENERDRYEAEVV